ncbi:hypothetical protein BDV96DRAFT_44658 [Lophiotrema nucula]|uniref:Uncharacterized protein n=1 Tax=Lophiotrema nucula TaxID=690887 RepID=A0A6A5ZBS0_9PLEO|nr:hypothetical protein BDV96DRAFT_44658 [Lophiotrema nucula]
MRTLSSRIIFLPVNSSGSGSVLVESTQFTRALECRSSIRPDERDMQRPAPVPFPLLGGTPISRTPCSSSSQGSVQLLYSLSFFPSNLSQLYGTRAERRFALGRSPKRGVVRFQGLVCKLAPAASRSFKAESKGSSRSGTSGPWLKPARTGIHVLWACMYVKAASTRHASTQAWLDDLRLSSALPRRDTLLPVMV